MTFGAHKTVCSEPFLDYLYEHSDMRKKFDISAQTAHLLSWLKNTVVEFFCEISAIYMKWCTQAFAPIF